MFGELVRLTFPVRSMPAIYSTYLEWELWWTEVQLKDCLCFYSLTTLPYWHSLKVVCKSRSKFISVQYPDHKCMHKHTFHYTLLFLMKSRGHGMNTHKYACHNIHSCIWKKILAEKHFFLMRPQIQKSYKNIR